MLIVTGGVGRGRSVTLNQRVLIGRDEHSDLVIPDPTLSRQHCVVERSADGFVIKDLQSRNGVFVNDRPVTEQRLADGDQIRIGDTALAFSQSAQPLATVALVDRGPAFGTTTVAMDAVRAQYRADGHAAGTSDPAAAARVLRLSATLQTADSSADVERELVACAEGPEVASVGVANLTDDRWTLAESRARPGVDISIHDTLARRALEQRLAVLEDAGRSVCAPLDATRVLQVTADFQTVLTDRELAQVAALAAIASFALERIARLQALRDEHARLHRAAIKHDLIGDSSAMKSVYRFIERVSPTEASVLLRGESGTGKELIAKAIHTNSARASGPFVAINCAAMPDGLLESELFGHERGAFTGAVAQQRGHLELANGGTVFLDEIGEMAAPLQAKLLRVLQERTIDRLGGRRSLKIDVRLIAATNRDLESAIASGAFRSDLFYRLNVVSLTVPPLRERREDIPLLATYFVRQHATRCKRRVTGLSANARRILLQHEWPGNVRELSNALERAVVLGDTDVVLAEDLPETLLDSGVADKGGDFHTLVAASKRAIITEALSKSGGNVAEAARALGLQATYVHRLIRNLRIPRH